MPRSSWKGPFVHMSLIKKVNVMRESGEDKAIKTWFRNHTITPDLVGVRCLVYNGKKFIPVNVTEEMVGHKLGEFSLTRTFRGHVGSKKGKEKSKKG